MAFPPFVPPPGTDRAYEELPVGGERPGTMLVLNRVLLDADGRPIAVAHVAERLDIVAQLIARARTILLLVTIAAMIVIVVASYFIAASAIDPIERLTRTVAEIGSERLDRRLRWKRRDEVGKLASAFDAMLDRLQSAFARERQFISDASHELRTPLTVINANAQMLQRWGDRDPEITRTSLEAIAEESGRLAGMVSGMLTLSKAEAGDAIPKEPVVIERLVDDVVAHAQERAAAEGLALAAHHPPNASTIVVGDAGLLRQLVGNLVDNAIKFTNEGRVDVDVRHEDGSAVIEVADTGPGHRRRGRRPAVRPLLPGRPVARADRRGHRARARDRAQHRPRPRRHRGRRGPARGRVAVPRAPAGRAGILHRRFMTRRTPGRYHGAVDEFRSRALRWIAAGLGALLLVARGARRTGGGGDDVVRRRRPSRRERGRARQGQRRHGARVGPPQRAVRLRRRDAPQADRHSVPFGTGRFPLSRQIPAMMYATRDRDGQVSAGALAPEEFPYAAFRPGAHDVVVVDAPEGSHLVVTVPASTGVLALRVGGGQTTIEGYRGANLFVVQGQGHVQLTGATTTAFVQMNYGTFYAADSTFDRIRVRGIGAHDVFEHCRSKQIEASSVHGSIVYDGGSFDPGLARFESQNGNIALGVNGGASVTGRSQDGHVYTLFDRRGGATVDQRGDGEATATVGGGGPLVNAISGRGNVFLYDGTLQSRRAAAGPQWRAVHEVFAARRRGRNAALRLAPPKRRGPPASRARRACASSYNRNLRSSATSSLNVCCGMTASTT